MLLFLDIINCSVTSLVTPVNTLPSKVPLIYRDCDIWRIKVP